MVNEKTSIFDLGEKSNYSSPFGNWMHNNESRSDAERNLRNNKCNASNGNVNKTKTVQHEHEHPCYDMMGSSEGIIILILRHSTMIPFVADGYAWLSNKAKSMDMVGTTEFSINAQYKTSLVTGLYDQGYTIVHGENSGGISQPGWYYIAQDRNGVYSFGLGDPPDGSWNAVGGGRPLIFKGLPFGLKNEYTPDAPPNLPETGDVSEENKKYLKLKSASYFDALNSRKVGKMVVAHCARTDEIIIVAQENEASGFSMDDIRHNLILLGCNNALCFDGSDSSLLVQDATVLIDNGNQKDAMMNSGITFSVPCT